MPNPANLARLNCNTVWMQIDKADSAGGYVFLNSDTAQTVPIDSDVMFNCNGSMQNVAHVPGTGNITVNEAGTYNITFAINTTGNNPQVWGIAVNGEVKSHFNCAGQTLVASAKLSLNAGDIISIRNEGTGFSSGANLGRLNSNSAWVQIDKAD